MAYASINDIEKRLGKSVDAVNACKALLEDAAIIIDAYNQDADEDVKAAVSCRMVIRALNDSGSDIPMGATQGSMSGLGYSQSWTISSGGSVGELYLTKIEKKMLGVGNRIGSYSPVEEVCNERHYCNTF